MSFETLVNGLKSDILENSLGHFAPELVICGTIVALLLVRLCNFDRALPTYWVALAGALLAFGCAFSEFSEYRQMPLTNSEPFFTGLLVYDQFTVFFRVFLLLFLILVIALTVLSGIPDDEDSPDFYALLLGSTIGMMLMASANHLLIVFLAVEMTSVPSYVMVGFLKGRRLSSEASFKYVVYGAGAAGVMLYGISLLAGLLGTGELPAIAEKINEIIGQQSGMSDATVRTLVFAIMMVFVGIAFKLSIVPFHFWCPDAFEGAPAEVAGFLSVASKAGAFALLVRFTHALIDTPSAATADLYMSLGVGVGMIAALTATFGNLAAYSQTNAKRLLAYSTIAHAGYMLMAVGAMMVISSGGHAGSNVEATRCIEGLLYYLFVYLFMNLGAFAVVALIRNQIFSEEISDYNGLASQAPTLCVCMAICLFSLVGLPPMGGFVGKFMIFASVFQAGHVHWAMWVVFVIGCLNTVFSLFYYLKILRAMFIAPRPEGARSGVVPAAGLASAYVAMVSFPVVALGMSILMRGLSDTANSAASIFFQ